MITVHALWLARTSFAQDHVTQIRQTSIGGFRVGADSESLQPRRSQVFVTFELNLVIDLSQYNSKLYFLANRFGELSATKRVADDGFSECNERFVHPRRSLNQQTHGILLEWIHFAII